MKTIKFLLFTFSLFMLKPGVAQQEIWFEHSVSSIGNPPRYPNLNSVNIYSYFSDGIACGDSGYVSGWLGGINDSWEKFSDITFDDLFAVYNIDSSSTLKTYIVGENGRIIKSKGGIIPFYSQVSPTTRNLRSVYFTIYSNGIIVGDTGTVIKTTDGGSHWIIINSNTMNCFYSVQFPSINIGYAVGQNGVVIKTTDGGDNWVTKTQPISDTLRCVWFTTDNTGFVVSRNGAIFKTTNGGDNWQIKPSGTSQNLNAVRFVSLSKGYIAGNNKTLLRTTDEGESWTIQTIPSYFKQGNYESIGTDTYTNVSIVGSNGTALGNYPESSLIRELSKEFDFDIIPNPAHDKITINVNNFQNQVDLNLQIYNIQGLLLLQQKLQQNSADIDISQLSQGVYIAKIILKDGSFLNEKFLVIK